jgi:hypothetical protein
MCVAAGTYRVYAACVSDCYLGLDAEETLLLEVVP